MPGPGPLFVADVEIASLARHGTSVRPGGGGVVVRNGSHARRVVAIAGGVAVPAGTRSLLIVDSGRHGRWNPQPQGGTRMPETVTP